MVQFTKTNTTLTIDGNGSAGRDGSYGVSGSNSYTYHGRNIHGGPGGNGTPGENGENIQIRLHINHQTDKLEIISANQVDETFYFRDLKKINIESNGGNGGSGGNGGQGINGINGTDGNNATQWTRSSAGTSGTDGGNGGSGGSGGPGGNGGDIDITADIEDLEALLLFGSVTNHGGDGGKKGYGGEGGSGGRAGQGGQAYYWVDHNFHTNTHIQCMNPGSVSGSAGRNGDQGSQGNSGENGRAGSYNFSIQGLGQFHGNYHIALALDTYNISTSNKDLIEPGQIIQLQNITIKNTETMPTPPNIEIEIHPDSNVKLLSENKIIIKSSIPACSSVKLDTPVTLQVANFATQALDNNYRFDAQLHLEARTSHVNQSIPGLSKNPIKLPVGFPIKTSTLSSDQSASLNQPAAFAIKVCNDTGRQFGAARKDDRLVSLVLKLDSGMSNKDVVLNTEGENHLTLPHIVNFNSLSANEIKTFAGTLQFINPPINNDTEAKFSIDLQLEDPITHVVQAIERRNFAIQFTEEYKFNPDADIILLTNSKADVNTVRYWKRIANSLGTKIAIWNTSLESELSYANLFVRDGKSLQDAEGKVVVVLDNNFIGEQNTNTKISNSIANDIFIAAKEHNIATYLIGDHRVEPFVIPIQQRPEVIKCSTPHNKFFTCNKKNKLETMAENYIKDRSLKNPEKTYITTYQFTPHEKSAAFADLCELGVLDIYEGLPRNKLLIATRKDSNHWDLKQHDLFVTAKLLSFSRKIQNYFNPKSDTSVLGASILSDLCNEFMTYSLDEWKTNTNEEKLRSKLTLMKEFLAVHYSEIPHAKKKNWVKLVLEYKYILEHLLTLKQKLSFNATVPAVINHIGLAAIKVWFKEAKVGEDTSALYKQIKSKWGHLDRKHLLQTVLAPIPLEIKSNFTADKFIDKDDFDNTYVKPRAEMKGFSLFKKQVSPTKQIQYHRDHCIFTK
ncbi:MAG: hypothetical protein H0W64_09290 [Gammaproteobacteria bacterium]|nr:hypothetical protein [Gammaproteobacteria bacterium]